MKIQKYIATSLGAGYSSIAPGTVGAVFGIILLFFFNKLLLSLNCNKVCLLASDFVAIIFVTYFGVKAINKVHEIWPHDDNRIVIDEVVGVWIAALWLPVTWKYYFLAFLTFRFFDIVKPLFIRRFDKMKTDWSVMLDDILAGVYALIVMQIIFFLNLIK
jgi:phosphatidylglycerophosphatase A